MTYSRQDGVYFVEKYQNDAAPAGSPMIHPEISPPNRPAPMPTIPMIPSSQKNAPTNQLLTVTPFGGAHHGR